MSDATPSSLLDRLAASLGCSPEVFFGQSQNELSDVLEMLTLWIATTDMPTRMRALAVLRAGPGAGASNQVQNPGELL